MSEIYSKLLYCKNTNVGKNWLKGWSAVINNGGNFLLISLTIIQHQHYHSLYRETLFWFSFLDSFSLFRTFPFDEQISTMRISPFNIFQLSVSIFFSGLPFWRPFFWSTPHFLYPFSFVRPFFIIIIIILQQNNSTEVKPPYGSLDISCIGINPTHVITVRAIAWLDPHPSTDYARSCLTSVFIWEF